MWGMGQTVWNYFMPIHQEEIVTSTTQSHVVDETPKVDYLV